MAISSIDVVLADHAKPDGASQVLARYGCGEIELAGGENSFYERHLLFDRAAAARTASAREQFEAFARSVRDVLAQRWALTTDLTSSGVSGISVLA